jgi:uncharacterized membrane protein
MLIPFPLRLLGMAVIFDLLAVFAGLTTLGFATRPMIAASSSLSGGAATSA